MKDKEIRKKVREGYAKIAVNAGEGCCGPSPCCGGSNERAIGRGIGYSDEEMSSAPEGANLGLGCGNPVALASLREGDVVLDLGSGGGFDCFLAAQRVGPTGRVIGVDMTPEMLDRARENATRTGFDTVEFRLGEIENLPVADEHVDVVISNCVINLSTDKARVFREAFRVLKPAGRIMVSDIVLLQELPASVRESVSAYVGCISGAEMKDVYLRQIRDAGFTEVKVLDESSYPIEYAGNEPLFGEIMRDTGWSEGELMDAARSVVSIKVTAKKPA